MQTNIDAARVAVRYIQDWLGNGATWFSDDESSTRRYAYLGIRSSPTPLIEVVTNTDTGRLRIVWHLDAETVIHDLPGLDAVPSFLGRTSGEFLASVRAHFLDVGRTSPPPYKPSPATKEIIRQVAIRAPRWKHWTDSYGPDRHAVYFGRPPLFGTVQAHAWLILDQAGYPAEAGIGCEGTALCRQVSCKDDIADWLNEIGAQYQSSHPVASEASGQIDNRCVAAPTTEPSASRQQAAQAFGTLQPRKSVQSTLAQLQHHERCSAVRFARSSGERLLFVQLPGQSETRALLQATSHEYRRHQYLESARIAEIVTVQRQRGPASKLAFETLAAMDSRPGWRPDLIIVFDLDRLLSRASGMHRLILEAIRRGSKIAAEIGSASVARELSKATLDEDPKARALLISRSQPDLSNLQSRPEWRVITLGRTAPCL